MAETRNTLERMWHPSNFASNIHTVNNNLEQQQTVLGNHIYTNPPSFKIKESVLLP